MQYRPEIDGVRALAVVPVVWFHAGFGGLPGGFLGVDVFFVLSGFLITSILMREMAEGRFSLAGFYERRARRILPALGVVALACLPAAWVLMPPDQLERFARSLVALGLFASNLFFWRQSGYFAPASEEMPLLHTWSLGIEEQFYVIFPLLLLVLWRRGPGWVLAGLCLAALVSFALAEGAQAMARDKAAFYLLPMRGWELLAGALAAVYLARRGMVGRGAGGLAALGLALVIGSFLMLDITVPVPGRWTLVPVLGTVLVLIAAREGTGVHWLLSRGPMVAIGLVSYSAYLWHQPLFAFARIGQLQQPTEAQMAVLTVLTFVLAGLTWRFVEQPFRRPAGRGRVLVLSGAALSTMVLIGGAGVLGQGFGPARLNPAQEAILASATPTPMRKPCHWLPKEAPPPEEACIYFTDLPPTWAVLGDSHAAEVAHALAERLEGRGESLVHFSVSGCPPALGYTSRIKGCVDWTRSRLDWIEAQPEIRHVLIAYRHSAYLMGENADHYPDLPDRVPDRINEGRTAGEKRALYLAGLGQIITRLRESGREVTVMAPVPEIARHIDKLVLYLGADPGTARIGAITRPYYEARNRVFLDWLASLPRGVAVLDPAAVLCDVEMCDAVQGRAALYFDNNHLSMAGARLVVSQIAGPERLAARRERDALNGPGRPVRTARRWR